MAVLQPTNLETAEYGTVGWNAIYSANFQRLNTYLSKIWEAINTQSADNNKILVFNSATNSWTKRLLQGVQNRIIITFTGSTVTISTPQDLHQEASPTFSRLTLTQPTGQPPLTIQSSTLVTNLNADLVDNYHASSTPQPNSLVASRNDGSIDPGWINIVYGNKLQFPFRFVSTNSQINIDDSIILVDTRQQSITLTLPNAQNCTGKIYMIKKLDSSGNSITILPVNNQTIDEKSEKVISGPYESIFLFSNGTAWFCLAEGKSSTGNTYNVITTSSNLILNESHQIILCNASSNPIILTLPRCSSVPGKNYIIKKIDNSSNTVTITPNSGDIIDSGGNIQLIEQNQIVEIVNNGINTWIVIRS